MELETLSCNNCGAPIDVPLTSNFVNCAFCNSRLAVKRTHTTHYTEVIERLDRLDTRTNTIETQMRLLQLEKVIEELDNEWENQRKDYMQKDLSGALQPPTTFKAAAYMVIFLVGGPASLVMFFVLGAGVFSSPVFPVIFTLLILGVIVGVILFARDVYRKVNEYEKLEAGYLSRRRALTNEIRRISMDTQHGVTQSTYHNVITSRT